MLLLTPPKQFNLWLEEKCGKGTGRLRFVFPINYRRYVPAAIEGKAQRGGLKADS
jgi:hypothetical protein